MRNVLLTLAVLGLVSAVHSTPVYTASPDDIYREAVTDGYLIAPLHPSSESGQGRSGEAGGPGPTSTPGPSTSTPAPSTPATQSASLPPASTAAPSTPGLVLSWLSSEDGSGSGDRPVEDVVPGVEEPIQSVSNNPRFFKVPISDATPLMVNSSQDSTTDGTFQISDSHTGLPQPSTGQSTQGWMIIVAFIAGIAALVMLCVAIATRDKWNGPTKTSQPQDTVSVQQREQEMETFMHKEQPKENGKAAEYSVIPLDELPQDYSAQ